MASPTTRPTRGLLLGVGGLISVVVVVAVLVAALGSPGTGVTAASSSPSPAGNASAAPPASPSGPRPSPASSAATRVVRIGITLPISGPWASDSGPTRDAVILAINDAAPIPGVSIQTVVLDHGGSNGVEEGQALADLRTLVDDPGVVAVVGPNTSGVAFDQIPMSNGAGLLQCAASASWPGLTKGAEAASLRTFNPGKTTFLRLVAPEDDQGRAMAEFGIRSLGRHRAVVVDGVNKSSTLIVGQFVGRWAELKGTRAGPTLSLGAGLQRALSAAAKSKPDVVVFAGDEAGAASVRRAMTKAGLGSLPMLANEDVAFGDSIDPALIGSLTGEGEVKTYAAASYSYEVPDYSSFATHFRDVYGAVPGSWSDGAYACTQVILQAIRDAAAAGTLDREHVRAAATAPGRTFETAIGSISFNAAGDMVPGQIAIYKLNTTSKGWDFVQQFPIETP